MRRPALAALTLVAGLWGRPVPAADLAIRVTGIEHGHGAVRAVLYDDPVRFPEEAAARRVLERPAASGTVSFRLTDLEPGAYAVIAYHDENGDGRLNRFFGMMPTEGFGLSTNPDVMGPPEFTDAAFELPPQGGAIAIRIGY